ncbi:MAG: NUDIX domain-containing protein [Nitrospirales bacterium]
MLHDDTLIRPGVAAVVLNPKHEILLHRRRIEDKWAPVSGAIEYGETLETALHREILEETGLSVKIDRLVGLYSDPDHQVVQYPDGRKIHFITTLFLCRAEDGHLDGSDEGTAWGWFHPDTLPADLTPYARVWIRDALQNPPSVIIR